jgi:putative ABC transport system ATP-binding protein
MSTLLATAGLCRRHGIGDQAQVLLDGVALELAEAEFLTVMGPSGSGKSTLLHCLAGLERPDEGRVELAGNALWEMSESRRTLWRRKHCGFVFQFFQLLPDLSVRENLELPLRIAGEDPGLHRARLDELVQRLGLEGLEGRMPHGLSGGEMQRVSIARALALRPPLLFADEPTGNLSSKAGEETMQLFGEVRERFGTAILLVTHNPRDAAFGDRVLFLSDGVLDPAHELRGPGLHASDVFSRLEELGI